VLPIDSTDGCSVCSLVFDGSQLYSTPGVMMAPNESPICIKCFKDPCICATAGGETKPRTAVLVLLIMWSGILVFLSGCSSAQDKAQACLDIGGRPILKNTEYWMKKCTCGHPNTFIECTTNQGTIYTEEGYCGMMYILRYEGCEE
jgi:hypothetical protein